jgi:uncharacterized protein YwgA
MRDFDEMKLARVVDACDGIDGRIKMQKVVYLLTVMGYDLPFDDFTIRQLGPFSRAVACAADMLTSAEILKEEQTRLGTSETREDVIQYSYHVREEVTPLVRKHFDVGAPPGKPAIDGVARELKTKDRKVLEVAATRVFLEREGRFEGKALESELKRIKGHLAESFAEADVLLADLRTRSLI